MKFISKIEGTIDRFLPDSDAWDYLPAKAKDVLRAGGYLKTDFTATVVPAESSTSKKPFALLRFKNRAAHKDAAKHLFLHDLKALQSAGLIVLIADGVLELSLDLEDYYKVKEVVRPKG